MGTRCAATAIMIDMGAYLSDGELVVRDGHDRYLGTAEVAGDFRLVRSCRAGRPYRIPIENVVKIAAPGDPTGDS